MWRGKNCHFIALCINCTLLCCFDNSNTDRNEIPFSSIISQMISTVSPSVQHFPINSGNSKHSDFSQFFTIKAFSFHFKALNEKTNGNSFVAFRVPWRCLSSLLFPTQQIGTRTVFAFSPLHEVLSSFSPDFFSSFFLYSSFQFIFRHILKFKRFFYSSLTPGLFFLPLPSKSSRNPILGRIYNEDHRGVSGFIKPSSAPP